VPENELNRPKHILILRLSAIGDVAMIVPVVLALRQQYPLLKITVVSRPFFKTFFSSIPNVQFYPADVENSNSGLLGLYQLYRSLSQFWTNQVLFLTEGGISVIGSETTGRLRAFMSTAQKEMPVSRSTRPTAFPVVP